MTAPISGNAPLVIRGSAEEVERVAQVLRAECLNLFGRCWSIPVAEQFARAAISALGSPVATSPSNEAELVHKSSPGEPVAWQYRCREKKNDSAWKDWTYAGKSDDWHRRHYALDLRDGFMELRPVFAAAPQPVACSEGWKLVPVEPTPEMIGAWYRHKSGFRFHDEPPPTETSDYGAYRAMLAAAPSFENTASPKSGARNG